MALGSSQHSTPNNGMNGQVFSALIEGGGKVMTTTLPHLIAPLHRQLPVESQLSHKFIR